MGGRGWAPGSVQSVNELQQNHESGSWTVLPYIVELDAPLSRLISVPRDASSCAVPEVCFGRCVGGTYLAAACLPHGAAGKRPKLRFAAGERVSCLVEDASGERSEWAAGTVAAVWRPVEEGAAALDGVPPDDAAAVPTAPYAIDLDGGGTVLAHRDEHWLVREQRLQPAGPHSDDNRSRFTKRPRDADAEEWEEVDQQTRRVRPCPAPAKQEGGEGSASGDGDEFQCGVCED
jgi:hypothetical protein